MFDNIKEIWFTSKLKGQCKITESLLLTDPQVNSIRECTRILKNSCLNFLPALIEDYDVTSDALTVWCQWKFYSRVLTFVCTYVGSYQFRHRALIGSTRSRRRRRRMNMR